MKFLVLAAALVLSALASMAVSDGKPLFLDEKPASEYEYVSKTEVYNTTVYVPYTDKKTKRQIRGLQAHDQVQDQEIGQLQQQNALDNQRDAVQSGQISGLQGHDQTQDGEIHGLKGQVSQVSSKVDTLSKEVDSHKLAIVLTAAFASLLIIFLAARRPQEA